MNISVELAIMLVVQVLTIGIFVGQIKEFKKHIVFRLDKLEEKQDKHNNLIERMVRVEQSAKSAHHRIDTLEDKN